MTNIVHLASEFQTQAQNLEAEQAVLGAILVNNDAFASVQSILRPEHFYETAHGSIFERMGIAIMAGHVASPASLIGAVPEMPRDYLANIARAASSIVDAPSYATIVRECSVRRRVTQLCADAGGRAANGDYLDAPSTIISDLKKSLVDIERDIQGATWESIGTVADSLNTRIADQTEPMSTGLPLIDQSLDGGLCPGSLYAIEAPAGSFKTGTLGTIAFNMIKTDVPMLFVTVEMDAENILARMVASETGCNSRHLMDASRCDESLGRVKMFKDRYGYRKAYFAHRPGITADGLAAMCSAAMSKLGVKVIFIDYWQRIRGCGSRQSRAEFYEGVADWAADFAATNDVAVMMASQLNRQGDSFGSGGLERASAWLARLHKTEQDDRFAGQQEVLWVEVAKSRYSFSGNIGSSDSPAFRIDGVGPVLREIGDWRKGVDHG